MVKLPGFDQIARLRRQEITIDHSAESSKAKPRAIASGLVDLDGIELLGRDLPHALNCRIVDFPICSNALGRLAHSERVPEGDGSTTITRNTTRCHDGLVEKRVPIGAIRHHLQADRDPAKALTKDGDVVGITAKGCDVILDPLQSQVLIPESKILGSGGFESIRSRESKHANAVIHRHVDDRLVILGRLLDEPLRLEEVVVCLADNRASCLGCNESAYCCQHSPH